MVLNFLYYYTFFLLILNNYKWKGEKFDAVVSWLTLYHIKENNVLLEKCYNLLKTDGFFYTEDLLSKKN